MYLREKLEELFLFQRTGLATGVELKKGVLGNEQDFAEETSSGE